MLACMQGRSGVFSGVALAAVCDTIPSPNAAYPSPFDQQAVATSIDFQGKYVRANIPERHRCHA